MNKREFLKAGFLGLAGLSALRTRANSTTKLSSTNAFNVPTLPYQKGINKVFAESSYQTLFKKHISDSIEALNVEVKSFTIVPRSVRSIIVRDNGYNEALTQHACDFYNHKLFFKMVSEEPSYVEATTTLTDAINRDFGSLIELRNELKHTGSSQIEDCWLWVTNTSNGLNITTTRDKQNPLSRSSSEFPIMGIDLCHSTYGLDYNNKNQYLDRVLENINWAYVNKRLKSSFVFLQG